MYNFVNDECINGLLLPKLLACEVVQAHDRSLICECGVVCEAHGDDRRCWQATNGDGWVACDALILGIGEHECKMAVSFSPARCFDGCRDLCNLLPEMVDGGGRWLSDNLVKW